MLIKDTGGDFEQPEAGSYACVCYRVIDLGTQRGGWQGKEIHNRQIFVAWELDDHMSDGRPFVVGNFYTASISEKANFRKHLAAWRGRDFTDEELAGFDPKEILGAPGMISLTLKDNGKIKVTGISRLPKGMVAPVLQNEKIYFSLEHGEFDESLLEKIGKGLQQKIISSPEYMERVAEQHPGRVPQNNNGFDDFDSDVPF